MDIQIRKWRKNSSWFFLLRSKIRTWTHWYSERMKKKQIEYSGGTKISELYWDKTGNLISCL